MRQNPKTLDKIIRVCHKKKSVTMIYELTFRFKHLIAFKQINDTNITPNQTPTLQKWFTLHKSGRNTWLTTFLVFGSTGFTNYGNLLKIGQAIFEKSMHLEVCAVGRRTTVFLKMRPLQFSVGRWYSKITEILFTRYSKFWNWEPL